MATTSEQFENSVKHRRSRRRYWLAAVILVAVTAASGIVWLSLPDSDQGASVLPSSQEVGIEPRFGDAIPGHLSFRDEHGRPVRLQKFLGGKPVLLTLVYFQCPMLCNLTMDGLVRGLRGLSQDVGDDFQVLTVSFDPREGPELAAAAKHTAITRYGRENASQGWQFLTGNRNSIRQLADAVGFRYKFDDESGQFAHAAGLFVLTPDGEVSRFLGGVEFAPRDVQMALAEASAGTTGTLADQVLLLCFHYDPANGKYGLAILRLIRFAGVLTVGLLVAGIILMSRTSRRAAADHLSPALDRIAEGQNG